MLAEQYYVRWRGELSGPFELDQLQEMATQGRISKLHDVSTDQVEWRRAETYADVFPPHGLSAKPLPEPTPQLEEAPEPHAAQGAPQQAPGAEPGTGRWYCSLEGEVDGPYDSDYIANMVVEGRLTGDSFVNPGAEASGWRRLREVPQFAAFLPPEAGATPAQFRAAEPVYEDYPYAEPVAGYVTEDYSGTALASLLLGLVGLIVPICGIVALVLGRRALRGMASSGERTGAGKAKAGLVLGCVDIGFDVIRLGLLIAYVLLPRLGSI